jgi:hypothetical protein
MSEAMAQIVDAYVGLKNRQALEDLRMHRRRLLADLQTKSGLDFSKPIEQIEEESILIESGLEKLDGSPD